VASVEIKKVIERLRFLKESSAKELYTISSFESLSLFKSRILGKKGELKQILSTLGKASPAERKALGSEANELQDFLLLKTKEKEDELARVDMDKGLRQAIDITEPAPTIKKGSLHPITKTAKAIIKVLENLGFSKAEGPEIEHDFYNFQALNIPKNHPARDMQDTFYIADDVMLRTHTSPVQIRAMIAKKTPLRIFSFGKVYRRDDDATHSPMFHQIEGLYVDEKVSMADLKGTLQAFVEEIFSSDAKIRMRPSFFPFTEPSIEVDVNCFMCEKDMSCRICRGSGWIEILGAGMVDPEVFNACGYDSERYRGFAFGMGIERISILRLGIPDIKLFFENDLRFLRQF